MDNETKSGLIGIMLAVCLIAVCIFCDRVHYNNVKVIADKVGGQVIQYGTGGDSSDYMIALPNGKCWYHPETTEMPK